MKKIQIFTTLYTCILEKCNEILRKADNVTIGGEKIYGGGVAKINDDALLTKTMHKKSVNTQKYKVILTRNQLKSNIRTKENVLTNKRE